jgi:DNA-binding NtrC family response regulator
MEEIKILAVDDEEGVLNVIKKLLRNYNVTYLRSSFEAAQLIEREKFDIYIIDYQMPTINGIELLEQIQEKSPDKKYICIFCTAYGTIHLFKEEMIRGLFDFFIEKPFEVENFKKIFDKAIIKLGKMRNKGN